MVIIMIFISMHDIQKNIVWSQKVKIINYQKQNNKNETFADYWEILVISHLYTDNKFSQMCNLKFWPTTKW